MGGAKESEWVNEWVSEWVSEQKERERLNLAHKYLLYDNDFFIKLLYNQEVMKGKKLDVLHNP
jgi:hypothetical protein